MNDPHLAAQEMARCAKELSMKGFQIGSHVNTKNLDDPCFDEVYKMAVELDVALFIHPWDMNTDSGRLNDYWMPWLVGEFEASLYARLPYFRLGMPCETAAAMCSVFMGGVLDRHPGLRLCFAHAGGAYPIIQGRVNHGFKVRPDLCAKNCLKAPKDYAKQVWVDSLTHDESVLKMVVEMVGEVRLIVREMYLF